MSKKKEVVCSISTVEIASELARREFEYDEKILQNSIEQNKRLSILDESVVLLSKEMKLNRSADKRNKYDKIDFSSMLIGGLFTFVVLKVFEAIVR